MILRLLLLSLVFGCQKKETLTDFSKLYHISSHFDEKSSALVVDIKLDKSIHAYAQGEKVGIPVRLELDQKNGWQASEEAQVPKGQQKKLSALGESTVLMDAFQVRQPLKKGQGEGEATLFMQVCSENTCDRPRTHRINF